MKKNIITLLLILGTVAVVSAQSTLKTSYFVEQSTMRHKLNSAFMGEQGYFAFPMLGDIGFGLNSAISLDEMTTPLSNGDLGLFLHPDVDSSQFLDGLKDDNYFTQRLNMSILSMGFYKFGGFNTFDLSVRQNSSINLKKSFFEFLAGTESGSSAVYNMSGSTIDMNAYAELAFGHSRKINDHLTVGAKFKYFVGLANVSMNLSQVELAMSEEMVDMQVQLDGELALMGAPITGPLTDFEMGDMGGIGGGGMAFDFGAVYEMDRFKFSASMNDLGFMKWKNPSTVSATLDTQFSGFTNIDVEDFSGSTESQSDDLEADFNAFTDSEFVAGDSYKSSLCSTLNLAAEYDIFEDKLSAGILYTKTFGMVSTSEAMLAVNYNLTDWFAVTLSGTQSTYGTYWGWMFNFSPGPINFYIGSDSMVAKLTPQGIPYSSSNFSLNFGLSFNIGAKQ
ncbi:MAG: DUF5723 family protein [Rikenellaceae bacterium]